VESVPKILVVDDEQDLREILEFNLSSEGFEIDTASSAEEALMLPLENYNLILLDVMMGGMSGFKMADILRKEKKLNIPVIFLTAKSSENELLTGFNVGADDYIIKPFSIKEVLVRIRAVLKRGNLNKGKSETLKFKEMKVDLNRKAVYIEKKAIHLTKKEFEILVFLMKNSGNYISRKELLDKIWSDDVIVTERNVDVNITRLRKKIGKYGKTIISQTGYGYCFDK
jgi:DNA-binding response OmpR family regulator